jgi:twitching motility protein PilT
VYTADVSHIEPYLNELMERRATDLHIAAGSHPMIRIDGSLQPIDGSEVLTPEESTVIVDRLIGPDDLDRFNEDRQLDFSFPWGDQARFRANAYYQRNSPAVALRLIPTDIPTPQQLGLPDVWQKIVKKPHGLVLATGPTGSGKSTSQAAMIAEIAATRACHILTIEDPIEYMQHSKMALVNQREVGTDVPDFAQGLRAALREDPDVVLVGELRDLETIALTLTLAETGHLVFGTLHTNDAAQTVDRLIDVFPHDQQAQVRTQLSMSLVAVIAQRLIPRIGGGRVAAFEVMTGSPAISNLIREGQVRQIRNVMTTSSREGMRLLESSLSGLVSEGAITLDDAQAISMYPGRGCLSAASGRPDVTIHLGGFETTFNLHIEFESGKVFGMTNSTSQFDRQRSRHRRGQSGLACWSDHRHGHGDAADWCWRDRPADRVGANRHLLQRQRSEVLQVPGRHGGPGGQSDFEGHRRQRPVR